ncbi:MAG: amino acid ABC transporter permease [Acidimicrobiales bacterium]|nr:amino acid ABC transporter permease [Acidimicrobiales bacterium]MYA81116.1 amino acid ABC transporter permease [Acidimicrobiales bacterium]MYH75320.1 amino acid ABC transporter permease [Acidimicrobiales bacterium]MYI10871.1 amino acid ABC transporter permease [Acidimicrobiales bacterium]MYK71376.1 amino acid ABC transporter permease [Acidimicrobiales bacterium]
MNQGDALPTLADKPVIERVATRPVEETYRSPAEWVRKNLFPSPFNSFLTVAFGLFVLLTVRGLLNFVFSEERGWDAVRTNLRLIFTHAYPEEQYVRVWVCVGVMVALAGLSLGLFAARGDGVPLRKISNALVAAAVAVAVGVVLREPSVLIGADGEVVRTDDAVVRQSFADAMSDRWGWWLTAAVLAVIALGLRRVPALGDGSLRTIQAFNLAAIALALPVLSAWIYPWGHYAFAEGEFIAEPGRTVAISTKLPWTVMWVLAVASLLVGRWVRSRIGEQSLSRLRIAVNLVWLAVPFVLYWVVLRDPDLDWARITQVDVPLALAFGVAGGIVLWWLTSDGIGELGRIAALALLGLAAFNWLAAFMGWYPMLQKVRISFLLLAVVALLAHNFSGETQKRRRLLAAWLAIMAVFHYFATIMNTPSTVETPTEALIGGFAVTLVVAVFTLMLSFPLGVLLALARTSRLPIFRVMATSYIEVVRGVPLITILIFFVVILPLFLPANMEISLFASATLGYTLFSAAYLAENVRGGLQSIRRGQYEASDAVGLSTSLRTTFVILPQALRASIPPLVGQVIATFKETSLLAIIGVFDILRMANSVIPAQTQFLGIKREGLLFVSLVYWVFAYTLSKWSQRLERRLGVGER